MALNERELGCPDHVDNKRLRPQAFGKPAGIEQTDEQHTVYSCSAVCTARGCWANDEEHDRLRARVAELHQHYLALAARKGDENVLQASC